MPRALIAAVFVVSASCAPAWAIDHTKDSLDTVKQNLAEHKAVLLDVREKSEWDRGHLKTAVSLPLSELKKSPSDAAAAEKLAKLIPKDQIVYCHCAKGVRALSAGSILERMGYQVRPLASGFDDLRAAGFQAVEK